jgi:hypothetical protein
VWVDLRSFVDGLIEPSGEAGGRGHV